MRRIRCIFTGQIDLVPIEPGIYPHGSPTAQSPILFTANYELTYIKLRYDLGKLDAWIVCVDSRGINVWCAARGPDFGNKQLLEVINATNLKQLTDHHRILLPQLAAGGVALPKMPKKSPAFPFQFSYGPIWSKYLPEFLQSPPPQKTLQMCRASFNFFHRTRAGVTHTTFLLRMIFIYPFLLLLLLGLLLSPSWGELAVELLIAVVGINFLIAWGFPLSRFTRHFILKGILFGGIGSVVLTVCYALFRHEIWIAFFHLLFYFWIGFFSTMSFSGYTFDTGPREIANEYPLFNKIHLITLIISLVLLLLGSIFIDPLFRVY